MAMGYPGGKAGAGVYQRIINQIPPHDVYVEPFLGEGAVLLRKRPAARTIAVELNAGVAGRFAEQVLAAGFRDAAVEVHNCCGIAWLKHAFALFQIWPLDPAARTDATASAARAQPHNLASPAVASGSRDGRSSGPADRDRWFVYLDPPYLLSTRRSRRRLYDCELTVEQHEELLGVIRRLPCCVAISGYRSPLYDAALPAWRRIEFNAMTRGGRVARECLWMNYAAPEALHDYRYLGEEKRERERIARKVRTWAAGLQRLGRHERQAILAALPGPAAGSGGASC